MTVLPLLLGSLFLSSVVAAPQAATPVSDYRLPTPANSSRAVSSASSTPASSLTSEEREELFSLHKELVNIPSVSSQEKECADFIAQYLEELDYHVEKLPVNTSTGYNVFAYPKELREQGAWPEVLITSHIDTVPPFYPFERREVNNKTYHFGRGTVDAKGPVATMIIAAHKFFQARSDTPRLGMLFVVEEETGGAGMKAFADYAKNTTFRAGIFGEPTEGKLASGHKGTLSMLLDVKGKSAHSAYPWLGVSAINYVADAIVALNALEPALPRSDLLGASTLNAGVIRGGAAANVVAEAANASFSIRIARSESDAVGVVRDMITGMLRPLKERAEGANGTFTMTFAEGSSPALILDTDVNGLEVAPVFYGTDIPRLPQVSKKYLYGTGSITVAHTPNEQLSQDDLIQAAVAYGLILENLFSIST